MSWMVSAQTFQIFVAQQQAGMVFAQRGQRADSQSRCLRLGAGVCATGLCGGWPCRQQRKYGSSGMPPGVHPGYSLCEVGADVGEEF